MALLTTGKQFIKNLEQAGALGVYAPLEGGAEGRYRRRLRAAGYSMVQVTARGLGDPASFLMGIHGVRPSHLGKKDIRTQYILPLLEYHLEHLPANTKGLVLWLLEGMVLSRQELEYLISLTQQHPKFKVVVEMGGDRTFKWKSLQDVAAA